MRFENALLHRLVTDQLGLLVNFVHLHLGQELARASDGEDVVTLGGFLRISVLFSALLESGLDRLRGLKSLQTLDVLRTTHNIEALESTG